MVAKQNKTRVTIRDQREQNREAIPDQTGICLMNPAQTDTPPLPRPYENNSWDRAR